METEFRRIFDTIPEQFDRYRLRYCAALFGDLIGLARVGKGKSVLELGPGTGQATEPILSTGCDYWGIELGGNLAQMMARKFGGYSNFHIINDDFITHDFGPRSFDMIYSAATIQWIPETIAFSKTFDLLRPGGTLAMIFAQCDYRTPNEALYNSIQRVYRAHFKPAIEYTHGAFRYESAVEYGFDALKRREYHATRLLTAQQYVAYCGTHCDHIVIPEPDKTRFFEGLRRAVLDAGDRIEFRDTFVLYLAKKPDLPHKSM